MHSMLTGPHLLHPDTHSDRACSFHEMQTMRAGDVMLHETYTSCIRPDGVYEGKTLKPGDVIELQRGGTGMCWSC